MSTATETAQIKIESLQAGGWLVQVVDTKDKKVLDRKYLESADVAAMFNKAFSFNTGILDPRIRAVAASGSGFMYGVAEPGRVRPIILYEGGKKTPKNMWVPPSFWIIRAPSKVSNKWSANVWLMSPTGQTSQYPLSNTYDNGNICWGNVRPPSFTFPKQVLAPIDLFFSSEFNGHLWFLNTPFIEFVGKFSTKKVTEDMNDEKRMELLLKEMEGRRSWTGTMESIWKNETERILGREDEF